MSFYIWLFKVAIAMVILGALALPFLKISQPEFYIDVIGIVVNSAVALLSFFKLRKLSGR